MGFPEDEVRRALTASFNDAERAVQYLMEGIPETVPQMAPAPSQPASDTAGGSGGGPLEALRQHPNFRQLRTMLQQNPQALPQVLQGFGAEVRRGIQHSSGCLTIPFPVVSLLRARMSV